MFIYLSLKTTTIQPKTAWLSINSNPDPNPHPESLASLSIQYLTLGLVGFTCNRVLLKEQGYSSSHNAN